MSLTPLSHREFQAGWPAQPLARTASAPELERLGTPALSWMSDARSAAATEAEVGMHGAPSMPPSDQIEESAVGQDWELIDADDAVFRLFEYPEEVSRGGLRFVDQAFAWGGYYLGSRSEIQLSPADPAGPRCLGRLQQVIRRGKLMDSDIVQEWINRARDREPNGVCFFSDFLHGALNYADVRPHFIETIRQRAGKTLLVPLVLKGGRCSVNHIVCLAISDRGLEFFDSQQTAMRQSGTRELTVGQSLGGLLSLAWITLMESMPQDRRADLRVVGNTVASPIQRDTWSCGTYVVGYMRARMQGATHEAAAELCAEAQLQELHGQLWFEMNTIRSDELARHSLQALVSGLEAYLAPDVLGLEGGFVRSFEPIAAVGAEDFDEIEAEELPFERRIFLDQLSRVQSVNCRGLCSSAAEAKRGLSLVRIDPQEVLHQLVEDILRDQRLGIDGVDQEIPMQGADGNELTDGERRDIAQPIAERMLQLLEARMSAFLPGTYQPFMAVQLLGLGTQSTGAPMAAVLHKATQSHADNECQWWFWGDGTPQDPVFEVSEEGVRSCQRFAIRWMDLRTSAKGDQLASSLMTSDFEIRFADLPSLVDGDRLDLNRVRGTLTLEPAPEPAAAACDAAGSSSGVHEAGASS